MRYYQIKMIRKGAKPPIWRRAVIPGNITFAQAALVLEKMLDYQESNQYEYEFYQTKVQIREWKPDVKLTGGFYYDYVCASDTYINTFFESEKWFSFRQREDFSKSDANVKEEYRIEIEKILETARVQIDGAMVQIEWPIVIKEVGYQNCKVWSDCVELNRKLREEFKIAYGNAEYKTYDLLQKERRQGRTGLILNQKAISLTEKNKNSSNTLLRNFSEQFKDTFRNMTVEIDESGENPLGGGVEEKPTVYESMMEYGKEELVEKAVELGIHYKGLTKTELAEKAAHEIVTKPVMMKQLYSVDEEILDVFEKAMDKSGYRLEKSELRMLEVLYNMDYLVIYKDDSVEIPEEVSDAYKKICAADYRKKHERIRWMIVCLSVFGYIHAVAPVRILYRMYRQKSECRVQFEEFMKDLQMVPIQFNRCVIQQDRLIAKEILQNDIYKGIEARRIDVEFYIPSEKEIIDYFRHGYPSCEQWYRKARIYLENNMRLEQSDADHVCITIYQQFSMGKHLVDVMNDLVEQNIVFESEDQAEEWASIVMKVSDNTRMLELRGHTPNEIKQMISSSEIQEASFEASPMTSSMSSMTAKNFKQEKGKQVVKKIYPNDPCPCGSGKKYKKCCGKNGK